MNNRVISPQASRNFPDCIFVTGATGVLGAHLVKTLLQESHSKLFCLVRAATPEEGMRRLSTILGAYGLTPPLQSAFQKRVIPVCGDVSAPLLGLTPYEHDQVTNLVGATIHVAALTNLFLNFRRIEPINVRGTANMIEFALKTKSKFLCHVSSHTISGDRTFDPTVRFYETDLDIGQGFKHMSYQETKFIAEKMVRAATDQGLVWNIVRPGQVFGESQSGSYPFRESTVSGLFYDIFKTIIDTRVAFESNTHYDIVPVDYVSHGILALALDPTQHCYRTFHLINPDTKTYSQVVDLVREQGFPIQTVHETEYYRRLREGELQFEGKEYVSATTYAFKWWFRRGFSFAKSGVTDCQYTRALLEERGIVCPPVDGKLISTYLKAAAREEFLTAKMPQKPFPFSESTQTSPQVSL